MIRGYVSSDEDEYDDYDFGYSEPLVAQKEGSPLSGILSPEIKEKLYSTLQESQKIKLFLEAVDGGDLETAKKFISEGLSPDSTDQQGWTPLMRACSEGNFEMVQLLLDYGADSNKHKELFTPLMTCCTYTLVAEDMKLNCARLLLGHGAKVNAKDKYRTTALMHAAGSGYESIVTELLETPGIDVDVQDKEGWTALFYAVNQNKINIVKKLVSANTDLKIKDKYERTALNLAVDKDLKEVAEALGYVEEISVKPKKNKSLSYILLKQLPDSNGQGGFCSDSKAFFEAFNYKKIKNVCFSDLLNATEEDLYNFGIKLRFDRLKILSEGIHQYHLHPWKTSSIHQISWAAPVSLEDIITITASLGKHLTIANASLKYVETRVLSRENKSVDLAVQNEMIVVLINIFHSVEKLKASLEKIIKNIEKIKPEVQGDFIYPFKNEKKKKLKYFWRAVGAATAGFLIFHGRSNPHLKSLLRFPYSFTLFSQPFQSESLYNN